MEFYQDVIAVIWDFDKTIIPEYSQKPLFAEYGINDSDFWKEVNAQKDAYQQVGSLINKDTYYLNHILRYVEQGKMPGLTLKKLKELGDRIELFKGLPTFFKDLKDKIEKEYETYGVKVEHYIVSTGMKQLIEGSAIAEHVEGIFSCEFLEFKFDTTINALRHYETIVDIGEVLDNTSKTKAIFTINKGANKMSEIDVNQSMNESDRRVPICNMLYIADGPSDIPAFSVVKKGGGKTLAVFKEKDDKSFAQAKKLLDESRVDYFSKADYQPDSTTYQWIMTSVKEIAENIKETKKARFNKGKNAVPGHIV
jgi:hypothetical protein